MVEVSPTTRVVILSAFDEIDYVRAALAAGVAGYLLKTTPADELVGAIRTAHSGVVVLDPGLSPYVLRAPGGGPVTSGLEALTTREREVVDLVAQGLPNKAIAAAAGDQPPHRRGPPQPRLREGGGLLALGAGPPGHGQRAGRRPVNQAGAPLPGLEAAPAGAARRAARPELLRDVRLWITLGLIALFAVVWQVVMVLLDHPFYSDTTNLLPLGVFLVPVLYASITFGLGGGMVVAITSAVATLPWVVESLSRGNTLGAWFDFVQVLVLMVVAYFVGQAVRSERLARQASERSRQDHLLAEIRYRDLFETNSQPILLADLAGVVQEANVAAQELFGRDGRPLAGVRMQALVGADAFDALREARPWPGRVEVAGPAGDTPAVLRPVGRVVTVDGLPMVQVVLQDVTEDSRRRQLAQAYAADVLRGQEDERRRIAQELHDGPLQTLVHVCRLIDTLAVPGPASPGPLPASLAQLRSATESAVAEVRQISRGLRPPLLDDLGLLAALQRLCDEAEHRAGVAVSLRVHGDVPRLSPAGGAHRLPHRPGGPLQRRPPRRGLDRRGAAVGGRRPPRAPGHRRRPGVRRRARRCGRPGDAWAWPAWPSGPPWWGAGSRSAPGPGRAPRSPPRCPRPRPSGPCRRCRARRRRRPVRRPGGSARPPAGRGPPASRPTRPATARCWSSTTGRGGCPAAAGARRR